MVLYPNKLPESERVCSGICNEDFKINSALNDIRKIMDNILPNYTKLVSVLNKSKGMQCNDRKTNYAAYYTCIFRKVFIRVLR